MAMCCVKATGKARRRPPSSCRRPRSSRRSFFLCSGLRRSPSPRREGSEGSQSPTRSSVVSIARGSSEGFVGGHGVGGGLVICQHPVREDGRNRATRSMSHTSMFEVLYDARVGTKTVADL